MKSTLLCAKCGSARLRQAFVTGTRTCEDCQQQHALTKGQKIAYWIILCLVLAGFVSSLAAGRVGVPGLLFFVVGYALWKSRNLPDCVVRPASADSAGR